METTCGSPKADRQPRRLILRSTGRQDSACWPRLSFCFERSEEGASLDDLVKLGQQVNSVTRSMGVALTGCTPPAKGKPIFTLAEDEMEMGVGIHGEPGRSRKKLASSNEIVEEMLDAILSDRKPTTGDERAEPVFKSGDEVALMVNGLGGTPISEL
jgi:phosphoenolpyruvate---glycerone phosphotransferase subunit DhaK